MTNVIHLNAPTSLQNASDSLASLIQCFAQHRRVQEDVFWLKENAEILNVLESTDADVSPDALIPHQTFYDTIEERMRFFPQYYRFLLSICLDLEDLGMEGNTAEALCHWVASNDLVACELSDLQRAEAQRLMLRRGIDPFAGDTGLETRLRAFISRPETFALPNRKVAYELTHAVFYLSEYGRRDPELCPRALTALQFAGVLAYLDQNADLLAEICISLRFAGVTPAPVWEEFLDAETHAFQVEAGAQWSMQDNYHDYLMCNWQQKLSGCRAFVHGYTPERMAFFRRDTAQSPLRAMSECLFHMGDARSADWGAMRAHVEDAVTPEGYAVLIKAEASIDSFAAFFEAFARPS